MANIVPLTKIALTVHTLCEDLASSLYKDQLYELADNLGLKIPKKATKKEICHIISEFLVLYNKKALSDRYRSKIDLSDSLRNNIDRYLTFYNVAESPKSWYDLFYSVDTVLIDLYNDELQEILSKPFNDDDSLDSEDTEEWKDRVDWNAVHENLARFTDKEVKEAIEESTKEVDDNEIPIFTDADREEIFNLHKALMKDENKNELLKPIKSYMLRPFNLNY